MGKKYGLAFGSGHVMALFLSTNIQKHCCRTPDCTLYSIAYITFDKHSYVLI